MPDDRSHTCTNIHFATRISSTVSPDTRTSNQPGSLPYVLQPSVDVPYYEIKWSVNLLYLIDDVPYYEIKLSVNLLYLIDDVPYYEIKLSVNLLYLIDDVPYYEIKLSVNLLYLTCAASSVFCV